MAATNVGLSITGNQIVQLRPLNSWLKGVTSLNQMSSVIFEIQVLNQQADVLEFNNHKVLLSFLPPATSLHQT